MQKRGSENTIRARSLAVGLALTGLSLLSILAVAEWVTASNVRSPWGSHDLDYLAGAVLAIVLAFCIVVTPFSEHRKMPLVGLWLIKAAVTLGPMLLYESHYAVLDAYSYHEQAKLGALDWRHFGWGDGTQAITGLVQALYLLLPTSYSVAKVTFSFVGLLGVYLVWRAVSVASRRECPAALFAIGLFPGILFWSSILGKEPLMIFALGMVVYGFVNMERSAAGRIGIAWLMCGIALASAIRPWMGLIFALAVFTALLRRSDGRRGLQFGVVGTLLFAGGLVLGVIVWQRMMGGIGDLGELVARVNELSRAWAVGDSAQVVPQFGSVMDVVKFMPLGMFSALFRPLPGEVGGIFGWLAAGESLVLLGFFLLSLFYSVRAENSKEPFFVLSVGIIVLWAAAYALISYQNLGTAVRFRAQVLPLFIGLVFYLRLGFRARKA